MAVVAGKEVSHQLMRCSYSCPWCSGLWGLSEVSAGLVPEPAWSFMASSHIGFHPLQLLSWAVHWWPSPPLFAAPSDFCYICRWKHPCWLSGHLAHLEPSASFMACWPVHFIEFHCSDEEAIKVCQKSLAELPFSTACKRSVFLEGWVYICFG